MHSLFIRIFLSFWLAMSLIGAGFALVYLTRDPSGWLERTQFMTSLAMQSYANRLVSLRESGQAGEAESWAAEVERRTRVRSWVVASAELATAELPDRARTAALSALEGHELVWERGSEIDVFAEPLAGRSDGDWVVIGEFRHPPSWARFLGPDTLPLRLLIIFVVSGLICFWLARQVTKPLSQLRTATRALAEEDLDVRVAPRLGARRDEIGALARDFDAMADRVSRLLDDQRRLLRDVSHELRSPLARLSVALELARQDEGQGGATAQLDRIEREAGRLNELIGQMLHVAELEMRAPVETQRIDLSQLVRAVVGDANFEAQAHDKHDVSRVDESLEVDGSAEILRRAIENVVRNGVRFTEAGTTVAVTLERVPGVADPRARIRVRDHGPGVPEPDLERIFQPFVRVGEARDRRSGGTGIGLAVTERGVRLHGGAVTAANTDDGGLVVTIDLPLAPAPNVRVVLDATSA